MEVRKKHGRRLPIFNSSGLWDPPVKDTPEILNQLSFFNGYNNEVFSGTFSIFFDLYVENPC